VSATLVVTVEGSIATLTLDRPAVGNTIDMTLARALRDAAVRCDGDDTIRCVVLTGRGRLFCGGGDVSAFAEAGNDISAFLHELAGVLHQAISRLMRMRKPLVVLVNGPAAGAGLSLALAGDITLAGRSAHFTAAYGALGLTPDGGMTWSLPRLVGYRRAQEIILANRRVSAEEAAAIGLITRAVADDALGAEGAELAASLARMSTVALGGARQLLLESFGATLEDQLEREARAISAVGATSEAQVAIAAFLAKRDRK
jgi:2-(1,2-epoxy-1,2-dihydrophenyl)acetyl-CoA isomerase